MSLPDISDPARSSPDSELVHRPRKQTQEAWRSRFDALYASILGSESRPDHHRAIECGLFPCSNLLFWTKNRVLQQQMGLTKTQLNKRLAEMSVIVLHPSLAALDQLLVALNTAHHSQTVVLSARGWIMRRRKVELQSIIIDADSWYGKVNDEFNSDFFDLMD